MPEDSDASIRQLVDSYSQTRPGEAPTVRSVLKNIVLPQLGQPSATDFEGYLDGIAAFRLYGLFEPERTGWIGRVRESLPPGETYQKAYFRVLRRLVEHGEVEGLLHPDQYRIAPAWRSVLVRLGDALHDMPPRKRSSLKGAARNLARWATTRDLDPSSIPILDDADFPMSSYKLSFPSDRNGEFYRARTAWNLLVHSAPELGLRPWGHDKERRCRGIAVDLWPHSLRRGIDLLFAREGLGGWRLETRKGYESRIANYLGLLNDLGLDWRLLLDRIPSGLDALRLMFQGLPSTFNKSDAFTFVDLVINDPPYHDRLLAEMHQFEGLHDGRSCHPNPLIIAALTESVRLGKLTSAHDLLKKTLAINRGILGITERHVIWCNGKMSQLRQVIRRNPSTYTLKKRLFFKRPQLWADLVRARKRLRDHTAALEVEWESSIGARAMRFQKRWAVALRNEVIMGFILCYPLRTSNLSAMEIDRHYHPEDHHIFIPPEETKNGKEIDYELPDGGQLGNLRQLMERYLTVARPILLGNRMSPFLFVPNEKGGIRIPARGFNLILASLSRKFFSDLLPVEVMNPHMARHAAACYHLAIGGNLNLAAQILSDSPATIAAVYADILESKRDATKNFLASLN